MRVVRFKVGDNLEPANKLTLCLGNFDGIHLGHERLILEGKIYSEGETGVLLFSDDQWKYLGGSFGILTSLEDKITRLSILGVDVAYVVEVDKAFFDLDKKDFLELVIGKIAPEQIVCGEDYSFGKDAQGNVNEIEAICPVRVVKFLNIEGHKIGSRVIKKSIQAGYIEQANRYLGRPYEIKGRVVHGLENGRKISFPTINLSLDDNYILPKSGVYLGFGYVLGKPYKAMINVGDDPTIGVLKDKVVEAYLLGYEGDAYGQLVYISFLKFLRNEIKFNSLDELEIQLRKDKEALEREDWR